jgi:endonuclease III
MPKTKKPRPVHHAADFDLDVLSGDDDLFRWFLLAYLFGKPIQASVAVNAWKLFMEKKLDTPWAILNKTHRELVWILDEGKYARYGETTARGLQICMQQLIDFYEGSLLLVADSSQDEAEFSKRLQKFHGIGPKTAEIFMTETEELFARRVE